MITASNHQFRGKISSLLEELLASAVTEICELFDNEFATLRAGCPRCKHPKEVERRTHLTPPHRNVNSPGNIQRLTTSDGHLREGGSRGEFEQNTNCDAGAHHPIQSSQRSMRASSEEAKHASREMMVSVKHEVVEDSELQRGAQHGHSKEGMSGSDISLPNSNLDLSTSLSLHTAPEWTAPEPFICSNDNCDPKVELENGQSSCANKDIESEKSIYDSIDYYHEQQKLSSWTGDVGSGHRGAHPVLMQHRDSSRDGQEAQGVDVEPGGTHFTHWTGSPLKNPLSSRHRKPPEPVSVFNISLSGAVSLDVRADGSANKLKTPLTRITSDQEKKFTCPLCGKRLRSEQTLKAHQKIHTGYAPHQCNQCGKSFSRLENLKVHQNIHTGLKPYTCKFCLKKFNAPSNFSRHKHVCLKRKLAQFSL